MSHCDICKGSHTEYLRCSVVGCDNKCCGDCLDIDIRCTNCTLADKKVEYFYCPECHSDCAIKFRENCGKCNAVTCGEYCHHGCDKVPENYVDKVPENYVDKVPENYVDDGIIHRIDDGFWCSRCSRVSINFGKKRCMSKNCDEYICGKCAIVFVHCGRCASEEKIKCDMCGNMEPKSGFSRCCVCEASACSCCISGSKCLDCNIFEKSYPKLDRDYRGYYSSCAQNRSSNFICRCFACGKTSIKDATSGCAYGKCLARICSDCFAKSYSCLCEQDKKILKIIPPSHIFNNASYYQCGSCGNSKKIDSPLVIECAGSNCSATICPECLGIGVEKCLKCNSTPMFKVADGLSNGLPYELSSEHEFLEKSREISCKKCFEKVPGDLMTSCGNIICDNFYCGNCVSKYGRYESGKWFCLNCGINTEDNPEPYSSKIISQMNEDRETLGMSKLDRDDIDIMGLSGTKQVEIENLSLSDDEYAYLTESSDDEFIIHKSSNASDNSENPEYNSKNHEDESKNLEDNSENPEDESKNPEDKHNNAYDKYFDRPTETKEYPKQLSKPKENIHQEIMKDEDYEYSINKLKSEYYIEPKKPPNNFPGGKSGKIKTQYVTFGDNNQTYSGTVKHPNVSKLDNITLQLNNISLGMTELIKLGRSMASIEYTVNELSARFDVLEERIELIEDKLGSVDSKMGNIEDHIDIIRDNLGE